MHLETIYFSKCSHLLLGLEQPHPHPPPSLVVSNVDTLVIRQDKQCPHLLMDITNVTKVQYRPVTTTDDDHDEAATNDDDNVMTIMGAIVASVTCTLVLVALFIFLFHKR